MSTITYTVAIVVDSAGHHRSFGHATAPFVDLAAWGTGVAGRHRQYRYFSGVSADRALELAAYDCAARCIDPIALEVSPTR